MRPAFNRAADAGGTHPVASQCAALMEAATPALFAVNAFRITGLPVDASPGEIARRIAALKQRRFGATAKAKPDSLSGLVPATLEQLRAAECRLQSPAHRLVDELFWFWPVSESGSSCDPALQAVAAGDYAAADRIWKTLATHPEQGIFAIHNQAVRWLLTALRLENFWNVVESDGKARKTLSKCWLYALGRWNLLLRDPAAWARIEQRIRVLYGRNHSPELGGELRKALPQALAGINVALTLAHAENDESSLTHMHSRLIRDCELIVPAARYTTMVVERAIERLRQLLRDATCGREAEPQRGTDEARALLRRLAAYDRLFAVLGCVGTPALQDLLDEGLRICMETATVRNPRAVDDIGMLGLLADAAPLARGSRMQSLVRRRMDVARQVLLLPLHTALAAVCHGAQSVAHRYSNFGRDVLPKLSALLADPRLSEEVRCEAADASALVLRTIAIDAWKQAKDADTAVAALENAGRLAASATIRSQIDEDLRVLTEMLNERGRATRKRPIRQMRWCVGAVLLCTLVADISSPIVSTERQLRRAPPGPAADSNVHSGELMRSMPRAPEHAAVAAASDPRLIARQTELARQLEAQYRDALLEYERRDSEAGSLERQARLQSAQNDTDWLRVDNSDSASLEQFRSKVDLYNSLLGRAASAREAADALLQPLDARADRLAAQKAYLNRLVDLASAR